MVNASKRSIYPAGRSAPSLSGDKEEQSLGKTKVTNNIFSLPGPLGADQSACGQ